MKVNEIKEMTVAELDAQLEEIKKLNWKLNYGMRMARVQLANSL